MPILHFSSFYFNLSTSISLIRYLFYFTKIWQKYFSFWKFFIEFLLFLYFLGGFITRVFHYCYNYVFLLVLCLPFFSFCFLFNYLYYLWKLWITLWITLITPFSFTSCSQFSLVDIISFFLFYVCYSLCALYFLLFPNKKQIAKPLCYKELSLFASKLQVT